MAHDVFICYSSKDKTTADAVCAVLESEGIRCWIAPRDILVGMSYGEAIVDAIHSAKALVLVFSGHANASPQIEREVERAINKRIPVIPLRIEDVAPDKALEYFLSTPHWLDAFTPPLERHLRNLAGQIHRLIVTDDKANAAKEALAGVGTGASPFKTVQTPEPAPAPADQAPPKPAAAASAAPFMPQAATATRSGSPFDFFKKLDTPQKAGIGAAALAAVIGVGWFLSTLGGPSGPAPGVVIGPGGDVTVTADGRTVRVDPGGVQVGPSTSPQTGTLPPDGNVVPGGTTPGGTPAGASRQVYETVSGTDVAGVLTEFGFNASVGNDNEGDPMIEGTIEGQPFNIFFYRCRKNENPRRCLDLQFHASFPADNVGEEQVNAYNRDNRFGQAYVMRNGKIGLDMSATLQGGVARQHVKEVIDWWKVTLTNFRRKLAGG